MKHKLLLHLLIISLLLAPFLSIITLYAADDSQIVYIEHLDNGYYYEIIIEDTLSPRGAVPNLPVQSITKTKTLRMKNSSGDVLWTVSITATFTYDGTSATCTSCTPSAKSYASSWIIKNITSSKSGNSAIATGVVS